MIFQCATKRIKYFRDEKIPWCFGFHVDKCMLSMWSTRWQIIAALFLHSTFKLLSTAAALRRSCLTARRKGAPTAVRHGSLLVYLLAARTSSSSGASQPASERAVWMCHRAAVVALRNTSAFHNMYFWCAPSSQFSSVPFIPSFERPFAAPNRRLL